MQWEEESTMPLDGGAVCYLPTHLRAIATLIKWEKNYTTGKNKIQFRMLPVGLLLVVVVVLRQGGKLGDAIEHFQYCN